MNFRSVLKKIGIGVHAVNQVTETPVLGDLLKSLPVFGTALNAVHVLDMVIPHSETATEQDRNLANSQKLRIAVAAVMDLHPTMEYTDVSALVRAVVAMKRREE